MSIRYNEKAYFEMVNRYENKIRRLEKQLSEQGADDDRSNRNDIRMDPSNSIPVSVFDG